jgi:branched-chain amino acid transport system permease protein
MGVGVAYTLQLIVTSLAIGSVYGLVALGFVLLVNSTNIINFAQGEFAMVGAFVMYSLAAEWRLPYGLAFALTLVVAGMVGVVFERLVYRPMKRADIATYLAATIAASVLIRNVALKVWGPIPYSFQQPFGMKMLVFHGVRIRPQDLLIVAFTTVLVLALYVFLFRTRTGKKLRAMSQDRATAQLLGIRVLRMGTLTFIMASMVGAVAGVLVAPVYFVNLDMGFTMGLKAFVATIIGGWGSVPGAIAGGLVVGIVETLATAYISSVYKDVFAFLLLIVFLIVLPQGIFGEKVADKA